MLFRRWRVYSAEEQSQGKAFAIVLATLGAGPLLMFLARRHYEQLSMAGQIIVRSKHSVTAYAGSDAYWLIGTEAVLGLVLLCIGLWWVRERLRRFPH